MNAKILNEINEIKSFYAGDKKQKRFSALVTGTSGSGKTFLLRTCRLPIHIDSFDPGGSKNLRDMIDAGDVVVDTRWEREDPFNPTAFAEWKKVTERRLLTGYFNAFGTYCLDSMTTWGQAVMNDVLRANQRAGQTPSRNHDYMPQKTAMVNYIRRLLNTDCDVIMTGHLKDEGRLIAMDTKTGIETRTVEYRLMIVGDAQITVPLLFDEMYVLQTKQAGGKLERSLLLEAQDKFHARSRLRSDNKLNSVEPADIKAILRKVGLSADDKDKLELTETNETN